MELQQSTDLTAKNPQAVTTAAVPKSYVKERYIPVRAIALALRDAHGRTSLAARALNISESRLLSRIRRSPMLQEAVTENVKYWEDNAEKTLVECAVEVKHIPGLMFFLRSKGRKPELALDQEPESELPLVYDLFANATIAQQPNNDLHNDTNIQTANES
jgi:hypothetical protein